MKIACSPIRCKKGVYSSKLFGSGTRRLYRRRTARVETRQYFVPDHLAFRLHSDKPNTSKVNESGLNKEVFMLSKVKNNALSLVTIIVMVVASIVYLTAGVAVTSGSSWNDRSAVAPTPTPAPTPCTPDDPQKPCPTPSPGGTPMPTPSPTMQP